MNEWKENRIDPVITDPTADIEEAKIIYEVKFENMGEIRDMDAIIFAVAHDEFKRLKKDTADNFYRNGKKALLNMKGILRPHGYLDYSFWRLQ